MNIFIHIFYLIIILCLLVVIIWRYASRRKSLPCPVWLRFLVELENPFTKVNRADIIIQNLDVHAGMKILDIGCGTGRLTIPLAEQVGPEGEVVAIDIQSGMLRRAQEKAKVLNLSNIKFLQIRMGEDKLEKNQSDRALLVTVLGEIQHREVALKEIYDALKPGGILSITEIVFDPHFQSHKTVTKIASAIGFQEKKFYGNRFSYTLNFEKPLSA